MPRLFAGIRARSNLSRYVGSVVYRIKLRSFTPRRFLAVASRFRPFSRDNADDCPRFEDHHENIPFLAVSDASIGRNGRVYDRDELGRAIWPVHVERAQSFPDLVDEGKKRRPPSPIGAFRDSPALAGRMRAFSLEVHALRSRGRPTPSLFSEFPAPRAPPLPPAGPDLRAYISKPVVTAPPRHYLSHASAPIFIGEVIHEASSSSLLPYLPWAHNASFHGD